MPGASVECKMIDSTVPGPTTWGAASTRHSVPGLMINAQLRGTTASTKRGDMRSPSGTCRTTEPRHARTALRFVRRIMISLSFVPNRQGRTVQVNSSAAGCAWLQVYRIYSAQDARAGRASTKHARFGCDAILLSVMLTT
jgi:hypothetical protein